METKENKLTSWAALFCRIIVGAVFLYAGVLKAGDPAEFARAIGNYQILPSWAVPPAAIILPWVEISIGVALLAGFWIEGGSLFAAVLFSVFSAAVAFNLMRGLDISCGCFSSSAGKINWSYFLRDFMLTLMSVFVFVYDTCLDSPARWVLSRFKK